MRQLLLELELLAEGRTQTFDGRVAGSRDRSPLMRLVERPEHERLAERWASARSDPERAEAIRAARTALRSARFSAAPPRDSEPWQNLVGKDARPPAVVAREWRITRQYAWQLQQRYLRERGQ
jgi:hypothetical protein